jgi:hypothetical protein
VPHLMNQSVKDNRRVGGPAKYRVDNKSVSRKGYARISKEERARKAYSGRRTLKQEATAAAYVFDSEEEKFLGECVRQLLIVYTACGFGYSGSTSDIANKANAVRRTVSFWRDQSLRCGPGVAGCFKFMKYKLAAFFSAWYGLELPPAPFTTPGVQDQPLLLITGRAHRFVLALFRHDMSSELRASFGKSISGAKRGFPRPTEEMLEAAESATVIDLTTPKPEEKEFKTPWADVRDNEPVDFPMTASKESLIAKVRQVVNFMIPERSYTVADRVRPFLPSTRANFENSRDAGGSFASLLVDHPDLLDGLKTLSGGVEIVADKARVEESRGHTPAFELKTDRLDSDFARFYARLLGAAADEIPRAKPVGLAEALKVRVITKGPPLINTAMLPLQKFLWKCLSRQRITQLVGRPVTDRALLDVLGARLPDGCSYLSGDYSAATNELRSWMSEAVANAISDRLDLTPQERAIFLESLTGHFFKVGGVWVPQLNGQLMGSVTSFPVLCLANIAVCWLAMEMGFRRLIPFQELRLLVNGDDCVFVADEAVRRAWVAIGKIAGLRPSLGKYFFTPLFAEINSTQFWVDSEPRQQSWPVTRSPLPRPPTPEEKVNLRPQPFREIKWINLGLVEGAARSSGGAKKDVSDEIDLVGPWSLGSRHWDLFRTCPSFAWDSVNREFFRRHAALLKTATGLPWFLPADLGGLGLVGVASREDCMLARGAVLNWEQLKFRPAPLAVDGTWKVRTLAQRRLEALPTRVLSESEAESLEAVIGRLSVSTLFDPSLRLTDLHCTETETKRAMLDANFAFWRYLRFGQWTAGRRVPPFGYVPLPVPDSKDLDVDEPLNLSPQDAYTQYLFRRRQPIVGPCVTVAARSVPAEQMYSALSAGFHLHTLQWTESLKVLADQAAQYHELVRASSEMANIALGTHPALNLDSEWVNRRWLNVRTRGFGNFDPLPLVQTEAKEGKRSAVAYIPRVATIAEHDVGLGLGGREGDRREQTIPPGGQYRPFAALNFSKRIGVGLGLLD